MTTLLELKKFTQNLSILYVEDEDGLRKSIVVYLSKIFKCVTSAKDGLDGLNKYKQNHFDILICDIQMPVMNGLQMIEKVKEINPNQEIIILSAYSDSNYLLDAIHMNVNGYIIKPVDYTQMNQELYKSATKLIQRQENINYKLHLEDMVDSRTKKIIAMEDEKIKNFEKTILAFVQMIDNRDAYTAGHSQRVANYSQLIAKDMKCTEEDCELLYQAAIIHDVGKLATPDTILLKPSKLNTLEYKLIQEHVTVGYDLLSKIPMYKKHADIIIAHHERYDGHGYPNGLKEDEISLLSHILILADAFDAMTTNRIYKGHKSINEAIKELQQLSKKQFHPKVVQSAVKVLVNVEIPKSITQVPKTELEKERFSYFFRDQATNAYNYEYLDFMLQNNLFSNAPYTASKLCLYGLDKFNNTHTWIEENNLLKKFVTYIQHTYPAATVFRVHNGDFILIKQESLEIDIPTLEALDFLKTNEITIDQKGIDLKGENIINIEALL